MSDFCEDCYAPRVCAGHAEPYNPEPESYPEALIKLALALYVHRPQIVGTFDDDLGRNRFPQEEVFFRAELFLKEADRRGLDYWNGVKGLKKEARGVAR